MRIYILKRIFFIIPVIFCVVLLSFILLHFSPGDPAEQILKSESGENYNAISSSDLALLRSRYGLDLPLFYVAIGSLDADGRDGGFRKYIPAVSFQKNNQFHQWLFGSAYSGGILHGDLGKSWITSQPVSVMIKPKLFWSVALTFFSVLFAYLISIPFGIKSALHPGSSRVRALNKIFIVLFSLPSFWVASLLMFLLCNPSFLNLLPSSGVAPIGGFESSQGFMEKIVRSIPYLILPTICYTYSSLAFLSNNVKTSIASVLQQDYIRTARAKGLSEREVIYKHALRNALLPMITIFAGVFPLAIGGSVILETVFTIPGMGLLISQSISSQDYPVIITVFMLTAIVTVISFLISDILYAIADPRISLSESR